MKNYNDLTYSEKLACISLYPEEAKKDKNAMIRMAVYRVLGFTEEAKKDENRYIRYGAYQALGFTEEAKKDEDVDIREQAEIYFRIKGDDLDNKKRLFELIIRSVEPLEKYKRDRDERIRELTKLYYGIEDDDMIEINGKQFSKSTIQEALKNYLAT